MTRTWTILRSCKLSVHLGGVLVLLCSVARAQLVSRAPANYIPNDNVIVTPLSAEVTFYDQYIASQKDFNETSAVRQKVQQWQERELMAERYGIDNSLARTPYYVPNADQKFEYLQRSYFRYLKKKGERPLQNESKEFVKELTDSNEIDTIDEMEAAFRRSNNLQSKITGSSTNKRKKKVSISEKVDLQFLPRLEQGLMIVRLKSPWLQGRAWIAVNGETEVKLEKYLSATKSRFLVNYYVHTGEYLSSMDQRITKYVSARVTNSKNPNVPNNQEKTTFILRFQKSF